MALLSRAAVTTSEQFQYVPAGGDKVESSLQQQSKPYQPSPLHYNQSRLLCGVAEYIYITLHQAGVMRDQREESVLL